MKKLFASLILVLFLIAGCTGINASVATSVATDVAFVAALQNNPDYKAPVVAALTGVKTVLGGEITYDQLVMEINKRFAGKYAYVGIILLSYIEADTPISTSSINLLGSYKGAVIAKIDRLLLLASSV